MTENKNHVIQSLAADNRDLLEALKQMRAAFNTYSDEFNPGNKIKAICDWGMVNDALVSSDQLIKKLSDVYPAE